MLKVQLGVQLASLANLEQIWIQTSKVEGGAPQWKDTLTREGGGHRRRYQYWSWFTQEILDWVLYQKQCQVLICCRLTNLPIKILNRETIRPGQTTHQQTNECPSRWKEGVYIFWGQFFGSYQRLLPVQRGNKLPTSVGFWDNFFDLNSEP